MNKYIAILRGINVSGKNKLPMAELRQILSNKGFNNLQTYIQSGNLIFQSEHSKEQVRATISDQILDRFGYEVPVLVLTAAELREIVNRNPFEHRDLTKLHITFLAGLPDQQLVAALPSSPNPREEFLMVDQAIYVYCPDGYGRSKINNTFFEKKLRVIATTRNWKTCMKLCEMVSPQ